MKASSVVLPINRFRERFGREPRAIVVRPDVWLELMKLPEIPIGLEVSLGGSVRLYGVPVSVSDKMNIPFMVV